MSIANFMKKAARLVLSPLRLNAAFFVSMYVLGIVCALLTTDNRYFASRFYANTPWELLLDLYVVCALLALSPRKLRPWLRAPLYILLYGLALVDVYCYQTFSSTISPSMLMLVGETDAREAGDFVTSLLSPSVIFGKVGWILLLILLHAAYALRRYWLKVKLPTLRMNAAATGVSALVLVVLLITSYSKTKVNKQHMHRMLTAPNVGVQEKLLTRTRYVQFYEPVYRLMFSISANRLAARQVESLVEASDRAQVDSCSYKSPTIVLIIGESYGKHHSQQYGYFMPTTPRQLRRERRGELVRFTDVVSPWNLTSFVFKNVMSMHVVGQQGEWCDYPLFPELFRKAGYSVSFLTNQFLPKAHDAVYDFSGGFFLNDPQLSSRFFDNRNEKLHVFDDGLLHDYDNLLANHEIMYGKDHRNLVIFHLIGQHMNYRQRYPRKRTRFHGSDYDKQRPELNDKQRKTLAQYDNATLYNDSIVDQICRRFEGQDAIVVYMPDHGEECYEGKRGFICRNHSARIDYDLARYEFEIPFWVWCSRSYRQKHREVYRRLREVRRKPFMTDALPHMLLSLAGISAPSYKAEYDILSPEYKADRPRLLKGATDYDKLLKDHKQKK